MMEPPESRRKDEKKTRVTDTDDFPVSRSAEAMPKDEITNAFKLHRVSCHRDVRELRPTAAAGVYRSVVVLSPICKSPKSSARNTSCLKHKTAPQRKRQASPGHDCSAPSKRPCRCSISHKSDPAEAHLELQCHESIQSLTNHNPHHKRLKYHQNKNRSINHIDGNRRPS